MAPTNKKPFVQKCLIDIRGVPPEAYRLPFDGRQWMHLCRQRKSVAMQLASYANADGTNIYVGTPTVAHQLGWHRTTMQRIIDDLEKRGFLTHTGWVEWGAKIYRLNVEAIVRAGQIVEYGGDYTPNEDATPAASSNDATAPLAATWREATAPSAATWREDAAQPPLTALSAHDRQKPPTNPPTKSAAENPVGGMAGGLADTSSSSPPRDGDDLWAELMAHDELPDEMRVKAPRVWKAQEEIERPAIDEKTPIVNQLRKHGVALVASAMYDWAENRGLDRMLWPWKFWLEESGPLLQQRAKEKAGMEARRARP